VNGYLGGEWNGIGNYITVRDNRAHSWAEAYLGEAGWTRVDATPPAAGYLRAGRLRQLLESADFYWTRWVVGYDLDRQLDLARWLGGRLGVAAPKTSAPSDQLPGWALVLVAVAVLAIVASRRWSRLTPRAPSTRRRSSAGEPPVHRLYRRALDRLARQGLPRQRSETPREYARRVSTTETPGRDVLQDLTELYTAARFGGRAVGVDELRSIAERLPRIGRALP
jgi:protein-glutamine gamma-glutamyltransferase